jgi:hypothetical protein
MNFSAGVDHDINVCSRLGIPAQARPATAQRCAGRRNEWWLAVDPDSWPGWQALTD